MPGELNVRSDPDSSLNGEFDVWVVGRIGYDLYAMEHNRPLAQVEHFSRHLGGSSANIAVGLARLGLRVGIIGCVGKDALAGYLVSFLKSERVDARFVRMVEGYNTSLCLTEVWPPDRFTQVFYRQNPADTHLEIGSEELAYIRRARMFVTNGTSLSASPSREATMTALQAARQAGLRTVFDVDYRASSWSSTEEAGRQAQAALPMVDIVLGNQDELTLLTGEREAGAQAKVSFSAGVKIVVRKLGAEGVEAFTPHDSTRARPGPGPLVCAIGGGDGFAAGFLWAMYRGLPLSECLHHGNAAAAVVVGRVSCSDAMPRPDEIKELLRARVGSYQPSYESVD